MKDVSIYQAGSRIMLPSCIMGIVQYLITGVPFFEYLIFKMQDCR